MEYRLKERILKNLLVEITKKYDYIIGDYKALEVQYNERLLKDYLTGLLNREGFIRELKNVHERCQKEKTAYGVFVIDIDNFKYINGFYGHDIGDIFLSEIKDRITGIIGNEGIIGRIGGDEFGIVIQDIDEDELLRIGNDLRKNIEDFKLPIGDSFITATISLGISYNKTCKDMNQVFEEAATALAESKQKGKNIISFYDVLLQQKSEKLINGKKLLLKGTSEDGGIISYIQPIVDTKTKRIVGGELLARIFADNQIYMPSAFLDSAIYFGLIDKLEKKMIEYISKLPLKEGYLFFLNKYISTDDRMDLLRQDVEFLNKIQKDKKVSFILEITENSLFENIENVFNMIDFSKKNEIAFAIDDFGSGYTSLRYLYNLDVSYLKIDGTLIRELKKNTKMNAIIKGIVDISKQLGIRTIAEYIETEEDYRYCLDFGIDYSQGYLFYKPMPFEEFVSLI